MAQTSFATLAKETIASLATDTDAETALTFKTTTSTRANPWEKAISESDATQTITGFVFGPGTRRANGELIEQNERVVYFAALDLDAITLGIDTTVSVGGKEFATDSFNRIPDGGTPALYELFIGLA